MALGNDEEVVTEYVELVRSIDCFAEEELDNEEIAKEDGELPDIASSGTVGVPSGRSAD